MAPNKIREYLVERTTLRTSLTALIVAIIGVLLLVIAEINALWMWIGVESIQNIVQSVLKDVGSLLLASVAISLLWELVGKRAFLDELLSRVHLSEDIKEAGIIGVTPSFHRNIDWDSLFHNVNELDIFFLYGQTWRHTHVEHLHEAARRHVKIRVVLPDPTDNISISELSRRIGTTDERIQDLIKEAARGFKNLEEVGATVTIWYYSRLPLFSFYRFDHTIVLALYTNAQKAVPTFLLEEGGSLYNFVRAEFSNMTSGKGPSKLAQEVKS